MRFIIECLIYLFIQETLCVTEEAEAYAPET